MSHDNVELPKTKTVNTETSSPAFLTRAQREELKALSLEVFGSSSKYSKLLNEGHSELVTEEIDEIVPGENGAPDTVKQVKVPVKRADGALQYVIKRYTYESVKELMLELKKKKEEFEAMVKKMNEEQAAKQAQAKLEKEVQEAAGGSTL